LGSSESQESLLPHESWHKAIIARCLKSTRLGHGPENLMTLFRLLGFRQTNGVNGAGSLTTESLDFSLGV
jgi:hypothetical protein